MLLVLPGEATVAAVVAAEIEIIIKILWLRLMLLLLLLLLLLLRLLLRPPYSTRCLGTSLLLALPPQRRRARPRLFCIPADQQFGGLIPPGRLPEPQSAQRCHVRFRRLCRLFRICAKAQPALHAQPQEYSAKLCFAVHALQQRLFFCRSRRQQNRVTGF